MSFHDTALIEPAATPATSHIPFYGKVPSSRLPPIGFVVFACLSFPRLNSGSVEIFQSDAACPRVKRRANIAAIRRLGKLAGR